MTSSDEMLKTYKSFLILLMFLMPYLGHAQNNSVYSGLSVKGSAGLATLYGDISESTGGSFRNAKFGFGISGIKMFSSFFGIEVRYASGNLSNIRADLNKQFTGQVSEIGLSARLEPFSVEGQGGLRKIYPYARIGISNASYRAIRWNTVTNQIIEPSFGYNLDDLTNGPRENALSFPLGIGVGFRVNSKLSVEFEYNHSILNTDFLDTEQVTGGFNDMFGLTTVGIRYSIVPAYQTGLPRDRSALDSGNSPLLTANRYATGNLDQRGSTEKEPIDPFKNEIPYSSIFVESIIPDYPVSGEIFEVQLSIQKGDYTGPASLVQTFPDGFTAIEAPLRHARLTFENRQATITWNQMPIDSLITVRYHVQTEQNLSGPNTINGRIYYAQPNGNQSYQFVNQMLVINRNEMEMDKRFQDILSERKSTSNPYSTSVSVQKQRESELDRVVKDLMKNYEETGEVYPKRLNDPLVKSADPAFEKTLVPEKDLDTKIQKLLGSFGGSRKRTSPDGVDNLIETYAQTGKVGTLPPANKTMTESDLDRQIENLINGGSPTYNTQWNDLNQPGTFIGKQGVEFRIQVGAFKSRSEYTALGRKLNIRESVSEEYHNGLYKYTVGSLGTYRQAQQYRDELIRKTGLLSAFIVQYNNGQRIQGISQLR